jgi:hypothetical protein
MLLYDILNDEKSFPAPWIPENQRPAKRVCDIYPT